MLFMLRDACSGFSGWRGRLLSFHFLFIVRYFLFFCLNIHPMTPSHRMNRNWFSFKELSFAAFPLDIHYWTFNIGYFKNKYPISNTQYPIFKELSFDIPSSLFRGGLPALSPRVLPLERRTSGKGHRFPMNGS